MHKVCDNIGWILDWQFAMHTCLCLTCLVLRAYLKKISSTKGVLYFLCSQYKFVFINIVDPTLMSMDSALFLKVYWYDTQ